MDNIEKKENFKNRLRVPPKAAKLPEKVIPDGSYMEEDLMTPEYRKAIEEADERIEEYLIEETRAQFRRRQYIALTNNEENIER